MNIKYIIVGIALFILISIIWRLASRQNSLPCPIWLSWLVEMDNPFTKANQAQSLVERLHLELGMKVIDVGCGPGRVTIPTAQKVGPQGIVTAMDIQARMLERVQKKAATAQLHNIQFLQAGIGEKKLEHNYYDRALLVTVLGEIPNQHAAFKEIFNALKPGGLLLVSEVIFDPHFQRMGTVQSLANTIGFEQKETIGNRFAYTMQLKKPSL